MTRTGSLSRQHQHKDMRPRTVNRDPLRKVVQTGMGQFGNHEELECGHLIVPPSDFIGNINASRRRCWRCASDERAPESEEA